MSEEKEPTIKKRDEYSEGDMIAGFLRERDEAMKLLGDCDSFVLSVLTPEGEQHVLMSIALESNDSLKFLTNVGEAVVRMGAEYMKDRG